MFSERHWSLAGDAILAGRYNLLVGAGISLDSQSGIPGKNCPTGSGLAGELAAVLPGMSPKASLNRLRKAMTPEQVEEFITRRFVGCTPGATVEAIASFRWKRIFTLNVDDALERAYEVQQTPVQTVKPYNHDSLYESERNLRVLPVIHLHGWAREPERGYVFELAEYARSMARNNVWAHILSDLIRSEPFIVIGTLLEEPDLSFFLAQREEVKPRADSPPSILIEPYPDAATSTDCKDYGLELYEGTALDFLEELGQRFPVRPSVTDAIEENLGDISFLPVSPAELAEFNADFERVPFEEDDDRDSGPNFAYGHQASWGDIRNGRDLDRPETRPLQSRIESAGKSKIVLVAGGPGAGKSTTLRRLAWSLAQTGAPCLLARSIGRIRIASAASVLENMRGRRYVFVDNLADNIAEVTALRDRLRDDDVVWVGAERDYRVEHIEKFIGGGLIEPVTLGVIGRSLADRLVTAYESLGLAASRSADLIRSPLSGELIAVACCRILNNFEPLAVIVDKSLRHRPKDVDCYVFAALAAHCHRRGIELDVIDGQFPNYKVDAQIDDDGPLPLKLESVLDIEMITPANEAVSDAILGRFANGEPTRMLSIFKKLASAIAPRVNRRTIVKGDPCARIASRLFDYDEVVKPLLGREASGEFYDATKSAWEWNSRYWHQRAQHRLDLAGVSIAPDVAKRHADIAVQHARFAETIEPNHPFTQTTIGRMLFGRMHVLGTASPRDLADAIGALSEAIAIERRRGRPTIHPFITLFSGLSHILTMGALLSPDQRTVVRSHVDRALEIFPRDPDVRDAGVRLRRVI